MSVRCLNVMSSGRSSVGLGGCSCGDEPRLLAEGWQRRCVGDMRMVREAAENYEQLGFEVLLVAPEPVTLPDECAACRQALPNYRIVFTRKKH